MQRANRHRAPVLAALCAASMAGAARAQSAPVGTVVVEPITIDPVVVNGRDIEPGLAGVRVRLEGLRSLRPRIERGVAPAREGLDGDGADVRVVHLDGLWAASAGPDQELPACAACPPEGDGAAKGEARRIVIRPDGGAPRARRVTPKVKVRTRTGSDELPGVRVRTFPGAAPEPEAVEVKPAPRARVMRQRSGATLQGAPKVLEVPQVGAHGAPRAMALGGVAGVHGAHPEIHVVTPHGRAVTVAPRALALGGVAGAHAELPKIQVVTPEGAHVLGGVVTPGSPRVRTLRFRAGVGGDKVQKNECSQGRCTHGCGPC